MKFFLPMFLVFASSTAINSEHVENVAEEMVYKLISKIRERDYEGLKEIGIINDQLTAFDLIQFLPNNIFQDAPLESDKFVDFKGFVYPGAVYEPGKDEKVIKLDFQVYYYSYDVKKRKVFQAELSKVGDEEWKFTAVHRPRRESGK